MRADLLALAALVGCTSAVYVEPSGPTSATLRFENQGPPIFGYELTVQSYADPAGCAGRLLIASGLKRGVTHTARVAAETPFTFTLKATGGGASRGDACALAGSFVPRAGMRYVAVFRAAERKCEVLFVRQEITPAGTRRHVDEPSYRPRREPACL